MNGRRMPMIQRGAVGVAAVGAMALLASFYSVVSGAVDHAAVRRTAAAAETSTVTSAQASSLRKAAGAVLVAGASD